MNFNWVKFQKGKEPQHIQAGIEIPGWVDHRVPAILHQYCRNARLMVNIGVWKGASTVIMAEAGGPGSVVWAVDHFRGSPAERETNHAEGARNPKQVLAQFTAYITKLSLWGRVMLLSCDSVAASYYFKPGEVDLIYVDGGHDYESVVQDITNWLPKLKKGGVMLGDDLDWPDVRKALDDLSLNYSEPSPDKIWMVVNE